MKKRSVFVGTVAVLLMAGMNFSHVFNEYGFLNGNLCANILAQSSSSGGGSSSSGGSSSGGSSSGSSSGTGGSTGGESGGFLHNRNEENGISTKTTFDEPIYAANGTTIIGKVTIERTTTPVNCPNGSGKCEFNKKTITDKVISSEYFKN